jgi:uncharacterized membrane protein YhaH (DUF805 family)
MLGFLCNPNGRVSRSQFWLGLIFPQMIAGGIAGFVDAANAASMAIATDTTPTAPLFGLSAVVTLAFFWPNIAVPAKRFRDRGMSGWWVLWFLLIVLGGAFMGLISLAGVGGVVDAYRAPQGYTPDISEAGGAVTFAALCFLVSIAAVLAQFVILYLLPGQEGANRFGPDPRERSARASRGGAGGSEAGSEWADRLADPARLAAVAASVSARDAAAPRAGADRFAAVRAPRFGGAVPAGGGRGGFGRRGA